MLPEPEPLCAPPTPARAGRSTPSARWSSVAAARTTASLCCRQTSKLPRSGRTTPWAGTPATGATVPSTSPSRKRRRAPGMAIPACSHPARTSTEFAETSSEGSSSRAYLPVGAASAPGHPGVPGRPPFLSGKTLSGRREIQGLRDAEQPPTAPARRIASSRPWCRSLSLPPAPGSSSPPHRDLSRA
jgi:hypothetical protein